MHPPQLEPIRKLSKQTDSFFVFVSGQLGLVPKSTKFSGDTVASQTQQALENLSNILEASGTNLKNVVKITVLLADMANFGEMNEVYSNFFPEDPPARAAYAAKALPLGGLVEIEAIALHQS